MTNVTNLIAMDLRKLLSLRGMLVFYALFIVAFSAVVNLTVIAFVMALYISIYTLAAYDDQSRGIYLLGTLPVSRTQKQKLKRALSDYLRKRP